MEYRIIKTSSTASGTPEVRIPRICQTSVLPQGILSRFHQVLNPGLKSSGRCIKHVHIDWGSTHLILWPCKCRRIKERKKNQRITEYSEVEGTHGDHRYQLLALRRTPQEPNHVPRAHPELCQARRCDRCPGEPARGSQCPSSF